MTTIAEGSGNVFADIGLPDPETHQEKADVVIGMMKVAEERGLSNADAAKALDLDVAVYDHVTSGHFQDFDLVDLQGMSDRLRAAAPGHAGPA